jgi:hypothetical protein
VNLKVFENRVLSRIFGHNREEITGGWGKNCMLRSFTNYPPRQVLLGLSNEEG